MSAVKVFAFILLFILQGFKPFLALFRKNIPDRASFMAITKANKRSSRWPALRKLVLSECPACVVCGNRKNLVVHHIKPYHLFPDLELVRGNLIVLCEGPVVNCHFLFGHFRNWHSFNTNVVADSVVWCSALTAARGGQSGGQGGSQSSD